MNALVAAGNAVQTILNTASLEASSRFTWVTLSHIINQESHETQNMDEIRDPMFAHWGVLDLIEMYEREREPTCAYH